MRHTEQLSGGQQQRVAARNLAWPKRMLFDEVTSALDPRLAGEVLGVMEHLAADGLTMILARMKRASHARSEKVIYMRDGNVCMRWVRRPSTPELAAFISEAAEH